MKYKIIEFAINHQRFFNSLSLAIFSLGIFVYITIQKDIFPEIEDAFVNVQIIYPGASAEVVQQQIISPIEDKVLSLPEVQKSSSVSRKNIGITKFTIDRQYYDQLNEVRQLIQNAIETLDFHDGVQKPQISTFTLNKAPFVFLHLEGDNNNKELYEVSKDIETALQYIPLLNEPIIYGREEYQYQINVDPTKISDRGISMAEIYLAIQQAQTDIPSGDIYKEDNKSYVLSVVSPINSIEALNNIVVRANEQGQVILLADLAEVKFDFVPPTSFHSLNGKKGIVFSISKVNTGDIISLKKELTKLVGWYQEKYPNIKLSLFADESLRITERLKLLNGNLTIGLFLVFLVLVLFFNFSTALWTTMGVPVAFSIGLLVAAFLGVNINTISMIGFLLILGIVVDDGIIFSENAYRHYEMGKSPRQAVIDGMGEVAPSVIFAMLTTAVSFATQLSLGGKIGDFSKPLPIVMIATLIGSVFEALLVLPGHLEHSFHKMKLDSPIKHFKNKVFGFIQKQYERALTVLVTHRKKSLFSMIAIIATLTALMLSQIPFVFFAGPPKTILISFDTPVGSTVQYTKEISDQISSFLYKYSSFEDIYAVSGYNNESHKTHIQGNVKLSTSPRYNWLNVKLDLQNYIKSNNFDLTNFRFNVLGEDSFYDSKLEITVKGTNLIAVKEMAGEIKNYLSTMSNIDNPHLNISPKTLSEELIIDQKKAKRFGITPKEVAQNINMAYEGITVSTITSNGIQYDIKLQYAETNHTYTSLTNMKIPNKFARFVNLTDIATIKSTLIDTDIYTEDGLYAVKVQDSLYETSVLSNNAFYILADVQEKFKDYTNNLHAAPYYDSEKEEVNRGIKEITLAVFIGVSLVFLILLYMFNSFISTFLAVAGMPFIFFGLTMGLFFMNLPINNMALVGMLALLGLVVNDSIVLIEFLYSNLKTDEPFLPSLVKHVGTRFRPILMTTLTTLVGVAPIAFGFAGNEFLLQPLAVVIFFGVLAVSLITLILLPLSISIIEIDLGGLFFKNSKIPIAEFFERIRKGIWRAFTKKNKVS